MFYVYYINPQAVSHSFHTSAESHFDVCLPDDLCSDDAFSDVHIVEVRLPSCLPRWCSKTSGGPLTAADAANKVFGDLGTIAG